MRRLVMGVWFLVYYVDLRVIRPPALLFVYVSPAQAGYRVPSGSFLPEAIRPASFLQGAMYRKAVGMALPGREYNSLFCKKLP
jgi:hypothetical protein